MYKYYNRIYYTKNTFIAYSSANRLTGSPSCMFLALWIREAISWLREETSLRKSWFSRRRLEITCSWPCCWNSWGGISSSVWASAGTSSPGFKLSWTSAGQNIENKKVQRGWTTCSETVVKLCIFEHYNTVKC